MRQYTWDDLYERADGAACGEDTLNAKDEARWQVRCFMMEMGELDLDEQECPEDWVEDYCDDWEIRFDENGNIVSYIYPIKEAEAIYTGGGVWLFLGETINGKGFMTDGDNGWTIILDVDPRTNYEESSDTEWQDEHLREELTGTSNIRFKRRMIRWLKHCEDNQLRGGLTDEDIKQFLEKWRLG